MSFKLWSLDFINYPVSGIMWIWHKIFGLVLGNASPWTWVLSVLFLVFTLRAILFKPFMKQMDSQLKMQAIQPEMKRIREKYKDDRQRLTEEMMKLNKEHGVNPLASCLPMLLQAPAFIGLFQVIRHFDSSFGDGSNVTNNFFFSADDVRSFHDAVLFGGASLAGHLLSFSGGSIGPATDKLHSLGATFTTQLWVAVPLMIIAAVATHMTSRKSVARQAQMGTAAATGQMAIMQKLMLYVFPLFVLVIGWFYEMALLFYWLANNTWTFGQLWVAHRIQDRKLAEENQVVEEAKQNTSYSKPKPGARPVNPKKAGPRPQGGAAQGGAAGRAGTAQGASAGKAGAAQGGSKGASAGKTGATGGSGKGGAKGGSAKGGSGGQSAGAGSQGAGKKGAGKPGASGNTSGARNGQARGAVKPSPVDRTRLDTDHLPPGVVAGGGSGRKRPGGKKKGRR